MTGTAGGERILEWRPPGPGTWRRDLGHFPSPPTAHLQEMLPAIAEGFRYTTERYGLLFDTFAFETVNGVLYGAILPLAPSAFPARFEAAARVFETRAWREDVARWDDEVKPMAIRLHRRFTDVDPARLSGGDLATHVGRCHAHHYAMWLQHHRFNGANFVPVGDFMTAAVEWTGLPSSKVAMLLRGASPISRGDCAQLRAVVDAIIASRQATAILEDADADPAAAVEALASRSDAVGVAMGDWLAITGYRLLEGFDICCPTALERPALLVAALRAARSGPPEAEDFERLTAVRDAVPDEHRNDFDDRYAEARYAFHVRDERGIFSDAIAAGISRRAWLAAGDRLADEGVLSDPALAIDATGAELRAALTSADGARDLEERLATRAALRRHGVEDPPAVIGDPPSGPLSFDGLPPLAARLMTAFVGVSDVGRGGDADDGTRLLGVGASAGTHRGPARIVRSPDDLDRLDDGSVMVTVTTSEAFNVAISLVSALVTEAGGVLSHAGITAREFGIPAVVGATGATSLIPDGALVEVDGTTGSIRWAGVSPQ